MNSASSKSNRPALNVGSRLERAIQLGLIIILALMPFHAFLSVWLGHVFGHEAEIEAWKEILLLALTALSGLLLWREPGRLGRLRQPWVYATGAFVLIALIVTAATRPTLASFAFGLKTDTEFLLAGLIAAVMAAPTLVRRAIAIITATAAIVTGFALLEIFVLPLNFLTRFGYGPSTIMPYEFITGTTTPRFASTLGGPNQLGTYLILPLALSLMFAIRRRQWWWLVLTAGSLVALGATYSRGAWIGAAVTLLITLLIALPRHLRRPAAATLAATALLAALTLAVLADRSPRLHSYLFHQNPTVQTTRPTSDAQHAASLHAGLHDVAAAPLGHGLGSAGPATFHAGGIHIIENYYLQLSYETGLLGGLLFLTTLILITKKVWQNTPPLGRTVAAALIGISVVALVLPAWTDSSTALIAWIAAGLLAGLKKGTNYV